MSKPVVIGLTGGIACGKSSVAKHLGGLGCFTIDADKVEAQVKDGVLTVTIPKPPEAVEKTRKVKVAHAK